MRALTMDELVAVSGGWGLEGPAPVPTPMPDRPPETVIVRGTRRRPQGMTLDTFLQLQNIYEQAQYREVYCNQTARLETYLRAESDERDLTPWESPIVDTVIEVAVGFAGYVGAILGVGSAVNGAISDRYQADANSVQRQRHLMGCPAL
jgi:hypothetical protein